MQGWADIVYPEDLIVPGSKGETVIESIDEFELSKMMNKKKFVSQISFNPLLQFDYEGKTYQFEMKLPKK